MLYLLFGQSKNTNRNSDLISKELYKIFKNKSKAEEYKKDCEIEEPRMKFTIEEWEVIE